MKLFRYLAKEVYLYLISISCLLLLIFITHQFLRYLKLAASGKLPLLSVIKLMSIQVPLLLGFLLPLGLYLSLLLAYGRLYIDHEMVVISSSGVSATRLLSWTTVIASTVAVVVAILMFWVEPKMKFYQAHILAQAQAESPVHKIMPGKFQSLDNGKYVVYTQEMTHDKGDMQRVVIATVPTNFTMPLEILAAHSASQWTNPKNHQDYLILHDGERYQGKPGEKTFQRMQYEKYGLALHNRVMAELTEKRKIQSTSTSLLWVLAAHNPKYAAELIWRFTMPIATILLAWLAVPMSRIAPRQGRYAKLIPAILIFIVYADFLFIGRSWLGSGKIPISWGLWWLHGLLFIVFLVLWFDFFGWIKYSLRRRKNIQNNIESVRC